MNTQTQLPEPDRLPRTPAECQTLAQWRSLVRGLSQEQVAIEARVKQARISGIETGRVMPRRRYWPGLMVAYGLTGDDAPAHFYRMVQNARLLRVQKLQLRAPLAETHPLLALATGAAVKPAEFLRMTVTANPHAPAGSITRAQG